MHFALLVTLFSAFSLSAFAGKCKCPGSTYEVGGTTPIEEIPVDGEDSDAIQELINLPEEDIDLDGLHALVENDGPTLSGQPCTDGEVPPTGLLAFKDTEDISDRVVTLRCCQAAEPYWGIGVGCA